MTSKLRRRLLVAAILLAIAAAPFLAVRLLREPSNDRVWYAAQAVLPRVSVNGNLVELENVRDYTWHSESRFDRNYITRAYDLRQLDSIWFGVSRFGGIPGLAHAFLTFGFGDEYVAISVEARKEADEVYSPVRGLLRQYELIYVIGTERDVVGLRTNAWKEAVSLYPVKTTPERRRQVFLDMVRRAEKLAVEPEFYNTFTSSCSSNIVRHVNAIVPGRISFGPGTLLPGYADRLAYRLDLIDTTLPFEQAKERYRVDLIAQKVPLDDNFSRAIRDTP